MGQPLRAANQALGAIAGWGEYVQKNILNVLARQLPGPFSEITCQDIPESRVPVGHGGAEFTELPCASSDPGDPAYVQVHAQSAAILCFAATDEKT